MSRTGAGARVSVPPPTGPSSSGPPSAGGPSAPHRSLLPGVGFALVAATTFGSSGIAARPLLDAGWSAGASVLLRIGVAAVLLAVPALWWLVGRWRVLRGKGWLLIGFGVFAVAGAQLCYFYAVQYVSVGVALLLEYSGILWVVVYRWARTRVRPATLTLAGAVVALVGLALVLNITGGAQLSVAGVLWGLGASVGLAVYYVISARTEDGLPSLVVVAIGMVVAAVGLALAGLVGVLPMVVALTDVQLAGTTMSWMVPAAWLAVMTAAVAYWTGVQASRRLGSTIASFIGLTEVLFAVLFAWLLLAEVPAPVQLFGGALILAGVLLVRWGEMRSEPGGVTGRPDHHAELTDLTPG